MFVSILILVFSTLIAWYEGSELLHRPYEWKHTALISAMKNGNLVDSKDILQIDYFIYAAKFSPLFPLLMLLSGGYLIVLLGYSLLKNNLNKFSYFLIGIGILFLILSIFISNSPTSGLKLIFYISLLIGISSLAIALYSIWKVKGTVVTSEE